MRKNLKKRKIVSKSKNHKFDKSLLLALGILLVFGLVMLFSASSVASYAKFGNTYHYLLSQLTSLIIGFLFFIVVLNIDYHYWKKFTGTFLFASILLLIIVFIPGLRSTYGTAHSWIVIFGQSFQTSELVKISLLLFLSGWLEFRQNDLGKFWKTTFPFLAILGIISALMVLQPNLGTLIILISISFGIFFMAGARWTHLVIIFLLGVSVLSLMLYSYHSYQVDHKVNRFTYQVDRFKCLQDLDYSPLDKCYQVRQSLIAVGSGGFLGRGLGKSREKFSYLPEVWADSIFPIIAEETGFIFSLLLILLYLFIFYRGLLIAYQAPDLYGSLIATGVVTWFAAESFLNIGGMINLIPMTGVPLPFISAGGSAAVSASIALGILLNISKQTIENKTQR
jgi:cell division protein FtsW